MRQSAAPLQVQHIDESIIIQGISIGGRAQVLVALALTF